jgi:hypothetical protein
MTIQVATQLEIGLLEIFQVQHNKQHRRYTKNKLCFNLTQEKLRIILKQTQEKLKAASFYGIYYFRNLNNL